MDGVTLIDNPSMVTDTSIYDDMGDLLSGHHHLMPPASPPPESYMEIKPKRPRKKRDRYPELQSDSNSTAVTARSDRDLVVRAAPTVSTMDMMSEIKFLKAELAKANTQNDILNKKLLRMAEGTAILNQLQHYMQHLKILPGTIDTDQALAISKELIHHSAQRPLASTEMQNMSAYGAFLDACNRYPHLPIALFNLSLPTPTVILSNDAFNALFATDARSKPWIHFIEPSYLARTREILFRANTNDYDAIQFVQVYKGFQKPVYALDMHQFYKLQPSASSLVAGAQTVDLVFLVPNANLKKPAADDLTFWKAPLNDQGLIRVDGINAISNSSDPYLADALSSSSGISIERDGNGSMHPVTSSNSGMYHFAPSSNRIDVIASPSVAEVTTPPQDADTHFSGNGSVMSVSPRISGSPLDSGSPWMHSGAPTEGYGPNSGVWYDPSSSAPWQADQWSAMNVSGGIPIPASYGIPSSPSPNDGRNIEVLASPSSPGYTTAEVPSNTPVALDTNMTDSSGAVPFTGLGTSQELGMNGHFPPFTEDFEL